MPLPPETVETVLEAPSGNDDKRALPSFENSANPKAFTASGEDGAEKAQCTDVFCGGAGDSFFCTIYI